MALTASEIDLIRLFVAAVVGDRARLERVCEGAGDGPVDPRWREALLQVHLFAGFPRTIDALEVVERSLGADRFSTGARDPSPDSAVDDGDALFERIYGRRSEAVRARLRALDPSLHTWIREHAYGRVLFRPGLDPRLRELLAVASLAVTGPDRQLASHARGAVRCGATDDEVFEAASVVEDLMAEDRTSVVQSVLHRFAR